MSAVLIDAAPFGDDWIDQMVAASAERDAIPGLSGVVALGIGSKVDVDNADAVVSIEEGRLLGRSDATPEVVVGLSKKQVAAWVDGDLVLTEAYMKGDLKPVGASGPLFAALELLDWSTSAARSATAGS